MRNTTDTGPIRACEFCGRPLEPKTVEACGRVYTIGHEPCHCDAAASARIERMRAEEAAKAAKDAAELDERLRASGVPELYLHAAHPKAAELAGKVANGTGLFIHGGPGTGKTFLAASVCRCLAAAGYRVEFVRVADLMDATRDRRTEDMARLSSLKECRVLVLDDIGMENPTPNASMRLHQVIDHRVSTMRPTVYTSNYKRGEIAQRYAGSKAGAAIASRLNERTEAIPVYGEDRRLRHG